VKKSNVKEMPSVLLFANNNVLSENLACIIASEFGSISLDENRIFANNVNSNVNPFTEKNCASSVCKPTIVIEIATSNTNEQENSDFVFDAQTVSTVANKIKIALSEVRK
jgi:hypothetical protein